MNPYEPEEHAGIMVGGPHAGQSHSWRGNVFEVMEMSRRPLSFKPEEVSTLAEASKSYYHWMGLDKDFGLWVHSSIDERARKLGNSVIVQAFKELAEGYHPQTVY